MQVARIFSSYLWLPRLAIRCFTALVISQGGKLSWVLCVLEKSVGLPQHQKIENHERKDQGRETNKSNHRPSLVFTAARRRLSLDTAEHFCLCTFYLFAAFTQWSQCLECGLISSSLWCALVKFYNCGAFPSKRYWPR